MVFCNFSTPLLGCRKNRNVVTDKMVVFLRLGEMCKRCGDVIHPGEEPIFCHGIDGWVRENGRVTDSVTDGKAVANHSFGMTQREVV
jgi:hypothetical protein